MMLESDKKLMELADFAIERPWGLWCEEDGDKVSVCASNSPIENGWIKVEHQPHKGRHRCVGDIHGEETARYVAAAANAVPILLKRIEALRVKLDCARTYMIDGTDLYIDEALRADERMAEGK